MREGERSMIIELFGPPGVGKTTLARALAARLGERGNDVKLVLSYRPAEYPLTSREGSARPRTPAALRRLARSIIESFVAAGHSADPGATHATAELMRLLAPANLIWSLRLRQYMLRLSRNRRAAELAADFVVFDQGFVQAVYTLALLARAAETERIGLALNAVPQPDLLVELDAPLRVLEARLAERRRCQGRIERLFDLDVRTNLGSVWIFDEMRKLLRARNRPVICATSTDRRSLGDSIEEVYEIIVRYRGNALARSGKEWDGIG
jgi:thymidylate kinase